MTSEEFEYFFDPEELGPLPEVRPRAKDSPRSQLAIDRQRTSDPRANFLQPPVDGPSDKPQESPATTPPSSKPAAPAMPTSQEEHRPAPASESAELTEPQPVSMPKPQRGILSVHALGQFVYCPRSAILAAEQGDDADVDDPPPRLDYLPNFDLELIEEELSKSLRHFWQLIAAFLFLAVLTVQAFRSANQPWFLSGVVASACCLALVIRTAEKVFRLVARRRSALRAEAAEPDPSMGRLTSVNWWSLLKAGFESVKYHRPFRHPELLLEGCPWRVLEKGSLRIPVVRSGSDKLGTGKNELYAKHRVRLAAYAMLLEAMGHVESPYGVVFPAGSATGMAIPITPALREEATRLAGEFSEQLRRSQTGESEPNPPAKSRCERCRYGEPVSLTSREVKKARKAGERLLVLQKPGGQQFRCLCGDRFGSAPPHGRSMELGLTAALD